MKNKIFSIEFNKEVGIMNSLVINADPEKANFIKEGKGFCELNSVPWYRCETVKRASKTENYEFENINYYKGNEEYCFRSFEENESCAVAVFERRGIVVEEIFELEEELLRVKINVKNENAHPFYFRREDMAFYVPFADSYDNSEISQRIRCHTHIAAFGENSWIQTERMGFSGHNIGVILIKGSVYSYSQENCINSNDRGHLVMNVSPFHLLGGETYEIELAVFTHKGGEDFFNEIKKFPEYIHVDSPNGFVMEKGEERKLVFTAGSKVKAAKVICGSKRLLCTVKGNTVIATLPGTSLGEKKVIYEINGRSGECYFYVSENLEKLQRARARFIVKHQQCLEKNSPLYGAYLIYANEEKEQYFSYHFTDHNANRERMVMAVFIAKYLRKTGDTYVKKSLELFTEFVLRECVDEETGISFNNIGRAANVVRLYNAPWVVLYFCELYLLTKEKRWIDLAIRMIIPYYKNGGTKFYPNGIRFWEIAYAIRESGQTDAYNEVMELFDEHIENLIKNGTNYPPHEVKFEQTIVTPAACLMLDKYLLTKDEKYLKEAKKHLDILIKFNGTQPDYRLNKVPLRYWDNYYFGKTRSCSYGDTLPHPALAHSAHCFYTYGVVTGDKKWINYGIQCWQSGYCLFKANGVGISAYVYPERVNGFKGAYYDKYANEQDGFLYLIYKTQEEY